MTTKEIGIRECVTPEELESCLRLQREVFNLPDIEISPVRHLIVTRHAGGFTLGAFDGEKLVGFVLSVVSFIRNEKMFYSHMTAIDQSYQNYGIGARLKWAQRKRALGEGVNYIKWTFQPVQARNAFFNLEKLGAVVTEYQPNFYGTDYGTSDDNSSKLGIDSDRLFAQWELRSDRVEKLSGGEPDRITDVPSRKIIIPNNWGELVKTDLKRAISEQNRVKAEFEDSFRNGLICRGFEKDENNPGYLLFEP
ncbi:MAG: GNAT family N-acetyltransferase [Pyrinomonadaceae bacterium]